MAYYCHSVQSTTGTVVIKGISYWLVFIQISGGKKAFSNIKSAVLESNFHQHIQMVYNNNNIADRGHSAAK